MKDGLLLNLLEKIKAKTFKINIKKDLFNYCI